MPDETQPDTGNRSAAPGGRMTQNRADLLDVVARLERLHGRPVTRAEIRAAQSPEWTHHRLTVTIEDCIHVLGALREAPGRRYTVRTTRNSERVLTRPVPIATYAPDLPLQLDPPPETTVRMDARLLPVSRNPKQVILAIARLDPEDRIGVRAGDRLVVLPVTAGTTVPNGRLVLARVRRRLHLRQFVRTRHGAFLRAHASERDQDIPVRGEVEILAIVQACLLSSAATWRDIAAGAGLR